MPIGNNEFGVFLWNIADEKEGFKFGKPWRQSEKSLGIVVPILRTKKTKRQYKMVEETNKVNIEDTGAIDKVNVVNNDAQAVFMRSGMILAGDTQERAVVSGSVVMPNSTMEVEVKCVHASKGIRSGTRMKPMDYAPLRVHKALKSLDQGTVWNAVQDHSQAMVGFMSMSAPSHAMQSDSDDLMGTIEEVETVKQDIEDAIKDIPLIKDQVGAIIFDSVGIVGFEVFDSPDSWKALHKKVLAKYSDVLQQKQEEPLFQLKSEIIPEKIRAFTEDILKADEKQSNVSKISVTMLIDGKGIIGEYTTISGTIIHMIVFKK